MDDIIKLTNEQKWINDLLLDNKRNEAYNEQIEKES